MKKTLSFVVVVLMVTGLLAACGTDGASSAGGATSQVAPQSAATGGEATATGSLCPYDGETVTLTAFAGDVGIAESTDSPVYKVYAEAVGNIEINWELVPMADLDTKASLYLNSGDIPDIMWYRAGNIATDYQTSGLFLDFNAYSDYTPNWNVAKAENPGLTLYETAKGEQFMIHSVENNYADSVFLVNKTLLDQYDIPVPESLEDLIAGMGVLAENDAAVTPFHTAWGLHNYKTILAYCLGVNFDGSNGIYCDPADGVWKHALLDEDSNYYGLIEMLTDFYAKGYINPEFATMSDEQTKNLMMSNNWGYTFASGGLVYNWYGLTSDQEPPVDIEVVGPLPASGVKPSVLTAYVSDKPGWAYVSSATTEYPELVASWIDTMLSPEVSTAFQWGVEGESYEVVDGEKQWKDDFLAQGDQYATDFGIWNILGPRYITWRDDTSTLRKGPELGVEIVSMLSEGFENGTIDSRFYRAAPTLDDEAADEFSQIMTAATTVMQENEMRFILGQRSLDEWDDFVAEVLAVADLERALEIYNSGKQSPDRQQTAERTYINP